ncbi:auxin-responsive protein IAA13-like isoform X1 [Primulina eburnea]|uniref:auxin-responsive protein IAA13-like isoform X1 n=1 Tax=Primulina eburnea TaxID=1245227 RepID=UPI003C6BF615
MQKAVIPGGGLISGGSMSTFSEESSSYPDGSKLELGLGLSFGGGGSGGKAKSKTPSVAAARGSLDHFVRILTAEDFSSVLSDKYSSSSSSSSSSTIKDKNNGCCGSKRTAEPTSPPGHSGVSSQVVGWPPIRAYRMNSLVNHSRIPAVEEFTSTIDKSKNENKSISLEKRLPRTSNFIKVNMEGIPIGRKVDLNAHSCYETLARKLDDMFRPGAAVGPRRSSLEEQAVMAGTRCPVRLLDDSSEFVLIYEDKEGDWMLVGDVPWQMFLSTVRRLKIMKISEANGLAPRALKRNTRQLKTPV